MADSRETAKAEAWNEFPSKPTQSGRYAESGYNDHWNEGAEAGFDAGFDAAWKARGEADAEAVARAVRPSAALVWGSVRSGPALAAIRALDEKGK